MLEARQMILLLLGCTQVEALPQLELKGPVHTQVDHLGEVEGPVLSLSDGGLVEGASWRVVDPSVAEIRGESVYAVGAGTTQVVIDWEGQSVQWTLAVEPMVMLSFVEPPVELSIGSRAPLRIRAQSGGREVDAGELIWVSSDEQVFTVVGGQAEAHVVGLVYVTARASGGSTAMLELDVLPAGP
jgi:hypothetical protein